MKGVGTGSTVRQHLLHLLQQHIGIRRIGQSGNWLQGPHIKPTGANRTHEVSVPGPTRRFGKSLDWFSRRETPSGSCPTGFYDVKRLREIARRVPSMQNGSGKPPGGLPRCETAPGSRPAGSHDVKRLREVTRRACTM